MLQHQLKRLAGIADDAALTAALDEIAALKIPEGSSAQAEALLRNLPKLLARVGDAYDQYERDLALRSRSLELSSDELTAANERMREELAVRNRALKSLRDTAAALLGENSGGDAAASLASGDLADLSDLMARLIEQRETQRRELDNQKYALDQHAIVSITDTDGVILYANDRFCEISGYARDELVGQPHRIVKSAYHPPSFYAELWQTISSGKVWHGEVCNRRKDGQLYWVAATVVPFLDAAGLPSRYIAIRTDITARKAMEAQLEDQLKLVEELVEAIPLPLYMKDTRGRYLRVNRAFELFLSVRREDVLGRTIESLLPESDVVQHADNDAVLLRDGGSQVYEAHVTSRDGTRHDTIYRKAALTGTDGRIVGLLGVIVDITERKQAEKALRRAMEDAEAANRAKSDFLANMSHEIRTPMNGVLGMTELALGTDLDEEQRDYLEIVKTSAESLLTIINDILDFSKIEAGKLAIERIPFHLPRLLADTTRSLALRAHEKGLELVLDLSPALPDHVLGDPGRLRQVLINLIGNAVKFTERGEIIVAVAPVSGASIRFSVKDTGIGIAAGKLDLIFEAFAQEDSSTTRRFGGTGLGLTICKRLVGMMQGELRAESTPGQGSTFHVELPLEVAPTQAEDSAPLADLSGLRALVVDDNETNRRVLAGMLARWGMQVETANAGAEALARLARPEIPDLLILDGQMPEMDGFELAARIQAEPRLAGIPRIMLSSGVTGGDAERCRELGIAAHFSKPCAQHELHASLCAVLGASSRKTGVPVPSAPPLPHESAHRLRVLLVEDHPVNQKLATSLLEKWGHEVFLATNGQEAVDRVASDRFDLILMDVQMPVMGGIEATQRIRLSGNTTPIIAMTANAMEGDREFCLAAGMDDYIAKPVKADALHALLAGIRPAAAAKDDKPAFDYAAALAEADAEVVEIIGPLFLEASNDDLAKLRVALAEGDPAAARRQLHTLRGLVSSFHATPLATLARHMEDSLLHGDFGIARSELPRFEAALAELVAALRDSGRIRS
jgi:PAS domain S-box-containing protein